jgi:hypothetical protein
MNTGSTLTGLLSSSAVKTSGKINNAIIGMTNLAGATLVLAIVRDTAHVGQSSSSPPPDVWQGGQLMSFASHRL